MMGMPNKFNKVPKLDDPYEVTVSRARKLWYLVIGGIIYSFLYTAVSLILMVHLSDRLQDSCASRQSARTAIRTAIISDPDFDHEDQAQLDLNLPPKVNC